MQSFSALNNVNNIYRSSGQGGGSAPGLCAYPLNDDGTIASMFGMAFAPAAGPGYQNITYVLTGAAPGPSNAAMTAPLNPFAPPALTTFTGRKGFGFTLPQMPASINDEVYATLVCFSGGVGNLFRFRIRGDGEVKGESGPTSGLSTDFTVTGVTITTAKFGMVADADTGVVHYYINGILVGSASNLLDKPTGFVAYTIYDGPAADVGATVQANIFSDAVSLATFGFTPGTTTLCGEVIASSTPGYPLDDNGTLAGLFGVGHIPTNSPIYNNFVYTFQSPSTPTNNFALPSAARFATTARIPLTGAIRGCEAVFDNLPTGDLSIAALYAIFLDGGGSPTGTAYIGARRQSGVNTYETSNGSQSRSLNSDFRVGLAADGNTGDVYLFNSENPTIVDSGAASGATYVVFAIEIDDDGDTPVSESMSMGLVPNAGDMSLFYIPDTLDYQDLPCPVNSGGAVPPVVLSAYTDTLGSELYIQYDQPITGTPSIGYTFYVNSNPITFSSTSQSAADTFYYTGLSQYIQYGDAVTVDYTPGDTESDPGGVPVVAFTGQVVTNNVPQNITCNYPFTEGSSSIVMTNNNMTGTLTLSSGSNYYQKLPVLYYNSPYQFNVTSGITVMEIGMDNFLRPKASTGWVARINFYDTSGNAIGSAGIDATGSNYSLYLAMAGYGSSSINIGQTLPERIGFQFDAPNTTMKVYAFNEEQLSSTYNTGVGDAVLGMWFQTYSVGGVDIGETLQMTVYTLASDFKQTCYDPDYLNAYDNCLNVTTHGAQYSMNDTGSTTTTLGFANAPANATPIPVYQNVDYTTTGNVTGGFAVSIPNFNFSPLYPTLGPIRYYGIGMVVNAMPTVGTGEGAVVALTASQFTVASTSKTWFVGALRNDSSDNYLGLYGTAPVYSNGAFTTDDNQVISNCVGAKIGILIDTYTGDVAYYVDGQRTLVSGQTAYTGSNSWYFTLAFADQNTGDFSPTPSGETYDATLLTRAEDLEDFGFPPATRDIQGNFIFATPAIWRVNDSDATISGDNLVATSAGGTQNARTTIGKSTGKWYWEVEANSAAPMQIGIGSSSVPLNSYIGVHGTGYGYDAGAGNIFNNNSIIATGSAYTSGDVIGMQLDLDNLTLEFFLNGVSQASVAIAADTYYPMVTVDGTSVTANFGRDSVNYPFSYDPGYGFHKGFYNE